MSQLMMDEMLADINSNLANLKDDVQGIMTTLRKPHIDDEVLLTEEADINSNLTTLNDEVQDIISTLKKPHMDDEVKEEVDSNSNLTKRR